MDGSFCWGEWLDLGCSVCVDAGVERVEMEEVVLDGCCYRCWMHIIDSMG